MKVLFVSYIVCWLLCPSFLLHSQTIYIQEGFEDMNFKTRGWYDNLNFHLSTAEHLPGGNSSGEFHFLQKAKTPQFGSGSRHKFPETDEVYISYYVKYSANWTGSNKPYHPHEFHITTNLDPEYVGPAYTHLTLYIEQNEGKPLLSIQDGVNIDTSRIGQDLTAMTEHRSVAGCNGDGDGYGNGECYLSGSVHYNGKSWRVPTMYFQDNPGPYYKNDWHHVEAYFRLNSIQNGKGVPDGTVQYWYDGQPLIDHHDVLLRTGEHPDMKFNQFLIAPYIGDGSPIDQTMWIDDLTVASSRPLIPDQVILISPTDNQNTIGSLPTFFWKQSAPNVTDYWLQIALGQFDTPLVNNSTLKDTMFTDTLPLYTDGQYLWRVRARNINGWGDWSEVYHFSTFSLGVEESFKAGQPLLVTPNPAHSLVLLSFELQAPSLVSLKLYTPLGNHVATIMEGEEPAGNRKYHYDSSALETGTYYLRLITPHGRTTHILNIFR